MKPNLQIIILIAVVLWTRYHVGQSEWTREKPSCPSRDSNTNKCNKLLYQTTTCSGTECGGHGRRRRDSSSEDSDSSSEENGGRHRTCSCTKYRCESECCSGYVERNSRCVLKQEQITCENGGTPRENDDGLWNCDCMSSYRGFRCEKRDCGCKNGAECVNGECHCTGAYTGTKCEKTIFDEAPSRTTRRPVTPTPTVPASRMDPPKDCGCLNGAECVNGQCHCTGAFTGTKCEKTIFDETPSRTTRRPVTPTPTVAPKVPASRMDPPNYDGYDDDNNNVPGFSDKSLAEQEKSRQGNSSDEDDNDRIVFLLVGAGGVVGIVVIIVLIVVIVRMKRANASYAGYQAAYSKPGYEPKLDAKSPPIL